VIRLAEAQCDYVARCDTDALHLFEGSSVASCIEYLTCQAGHAFLTPNQPWTAPGFDLDACVDSLGARPCPDFETDPFAHVAVGIGVSFPWGPECGLPELEDRLAAPPDAPGVGEACIAGFGEQASCQGDTYCAVTAGSQTFGTFDCGICAVRLPIGAQCDTQSRCTGEARCVEGACAELLAVGAICTSPAQCRFGACDGGVCGPSPHAPLPYAEALGRACSPDDGCGNPALRCVDATCRPLPDEGDVCDSTSTSSAYRLGQMCAGGHVVQLGCTLDLGEPCSFMCHEGVCTDGLCGPGAAQVGDACDLVCAAGLECIEGQCEVIPDRSVGAACDFDLDCDSSYCARDVTTYCDDDGCSIPACDDCGVCSDPPTPALCE
jgi:hypothetical protein